MNEKRLIDKVNEAIPNYPGRSTAERIVANAITPLARQYSTITVMRTLGWWMMWDSLDGEDVGHRVEEMIRRGWIKRTAAYKGRSDFVKAWKCEPEEFRAKFLDDAGRLRLYADAGSGPEAERATESPSAPA